MAKPDPNWWVARCREALQPGDKVHIYLSRVGYAGRWNIYLEVHRSGNVIHKVFRTELTQSGWTTRLLIKQANNRTSGEASVQALVKRVTRLFPYCRVEAGQ